MKSLRELERKKILDRQNLIKDLKKARAKEDQIIREEKQRLEEKRIEDARKKDTERKRQIQEDQRQKQLQKEEKLKKLQEAKMFAEILIKKQIDINIDSLSLDDIDPDTFIKDQLKKMVQEKKKRRLTLELIHPIWTTWFVLKENWRFLTLKIFGKLNLKATKNFSTNKKKNFL